MRHGVVSVARCGFCALVALLVSGSCLPAVAAGTNVLEGPTLITNLFQLRLIAEQKPLSVHPFRIEAEVYDVDSGNGVLGLHDASGVEFVQLDLRGKRIEPGFKICLEGSGCGVQPRGFGLVIIPGIVVNNDGIHGMTTESGEVFLNPGNNPITVHWFNRMGDFGLNVEYKGPGLPRQRIPSSVLSRANLDPNTGATHFSAGLNYQCYEGDWGHLPDFAKLNPVKTGVTTNFNLDVRTRKEAVGLVFSGFIKIPQAGIYKFYTTSDDASRLCVGEASMDIQVLSSNAMPPVVETLPSATTERGSRPWVTLEGTVHFAGVRETGGEMLMRVGKDDVRVEIFQSAGMVPPVPLNTKVRVSGIYQDVVTEDGSQVPGMLLVSGWNAVHPATASGTKFSTVLNHSEVANQLLEKTVSAATTIPTITTAAELRALTTEKAKQQLPVSIRGVVTAILPDYINGAVIQDTTKGVFISPQNGTDLKLMQRGEFYQIDGVTGPGEFAPLVIARRITHLGAGQLPQPLRPTWNQLFNGSLDTQYAELEGVVSAVHGRSIEMLSENGKIILELTDFQPEELANYENALVRIRGCAFAFFNPQTHELEPSSLRIFGGAVDVIKPAPSDLFDAPQKNLGELLLFDPKTEAFRRLKVSGQVIYAHAGEYFLTDGAYGMRVTTGKSDSLLVGDLVDAVGFLEVDGPVAELKEAVMRKTGHAPLPKPNRLTQEDLLQALNSGTLVQLDATLMDAWRDGPEYVLELQSGLIAFRARLDSHGQSVSLPPPRSRLELTGAYAPQGNRASDGTVSGFELLLHSTTDMNVLATPPWWTLKRVLTLAGLLALLLGTVLVWNHQLRQQVQERTQTLEVEIHNRQRAELQRAAETERSRIARDLHDELGTGLTEVSLLASTGSDESSAAANNNDRLRVIGEKARALVSGLDVIVWAIDPKRNLLQSFADYIVRYATELFSKSAIICRFKIPIECNAVTLAETARHSLFLAVKEALNNVIRHSSATEVELQISPLDDALQVVISDNGRGFDWNTIRRGNGLTNLHERLEALNGHCQIESQVGRGTMVRLRIPLPHNPH
jgi:signal transduction histidine kinase